eukprot:c17439_g1_i1.p1 GENE.c17439_g1_i1~~c17439_g1_i1.p1  ORF type:complete len:168 (+),score=28.22 c17439_g1_i1:27-506(+)
MSDTEETFEQVASGASDVFPMQAGQIKKGGYIVIGGFACKVVDVATSKTGKHGHAKASITALDIFTGKKLETVSPTTHNVEVPNVKRMQCILTNIDGEYVDLMMEDGSIRSDLQITDPEMLAQAKEFVDKEGECQADVLSALGKEQIMGVKKSSEKESK